MEHLESDRSTTETPSTLSAEHLIAPAWFARRRPKIRACLFVASLVLSLKAAPAAFAYRAESIACPSSILVVETASQASGWVTEDAKRVHPFERMSVFNKRANREFDLAPDSQRRVGGTTIQEWVLVGYRSMPVYIRCRYMGTAVAFVAELGSQVERCTMRIAVDSRGQIEGKSVSECR